jgi:hypothetical protein
MMVARSERGFPLVPTGGEGQGQMAVSMGEGPLKELHNVASFCHQYNP